MRVRLAAMLLLFVLARTAAAQQAIILVRHAEKAADSNEASVSLSEAGRARAARLGQLLEVAGVTAIYATVTERARQTAEPLARSRKLDVRLYSPKDAAGKPAPNLLVERLKKESSSGVVLVVGHSNTVPELLAALGHAEKVEIPSGQYDDLFVIVPNREGAPPTVLRLKY